MTNAKTIYNFNEKKEEHSKKFGKKLPVEQTAKYQQTKQRAIEMIEKGEYELDVNDFWILKNEYADKIQYNGLIITHAGCQKINSKLEKDKKFNQVFCSEPFEYTYFGIQGIGMFYRDEINGILQCGEINVNNLQNKGYPLAMLTKRLFDRVVLENSGLSYKGFTDEFENGIDDNNFVAPVIIETEEKVVTTQTNNVTQKPVTTVDEKPQVIETKKAKKDTVKQEKNTDLTLTDLLDYTFAGDGISMQGKTVRDCFENKPKERHAAAIAFFKKSLATVQNNDKKIVEQILNLYATHQEMFDSISYEALA